MKLKKNPRLRPVPVLPCVDIFEPDHIKVEVGATFDVKDIVAELETCYDALASGGYPKEAVGSLQRRLKDLLDAIEKDRLLIIRKVQAVYAEHYKSMCADGPPAHVKFRELFPIYLVGTGWR